MCIRIYDIYIYNIMNDVFILLLQSNRTALHFAACNGHVSVVQVLLTAGADINKCNNVSKGLNSVYVIDIHIMNIRCVFQI